MSGFKHFTLSYAAIQCIGFLLVRDAERLWELYGLEIQVMLVCGLFFLFGFLYKARQTSKTMRFLQLGYSVGLQVALYAYERWVNPKVLSLLGLGKHRDYGSSFWLHGALATLNFKQDGDLLNFHYLMGGLPREYWPWIIGLPVLWSLCFALGSYQRSGVEPGAADK